jgi:hypothetical protein
MTDQPHGPSRCHRSGVHPPPPELRRITKAYKRRRNDTTTFTGTNKTPSFEFSGEGEGRGTSLDKVALLIANLKETIIQQSNVIESVRADLSENKPEQQGLRNQNAELQEKARSLRTQLSAYSINTIMGVGSGQSRHDETKRKLLEKKERREPN